MNIICQMSLSVLMVAVCSALSRAGGQKWSIQTMFKVRPNPPETSDPKLQQTVQRALDHYLNPGSTLPNALSPVKRRRRRQLRKPDH